ncbi:MAG TPA: hypothetical protein VK568_05665 [Thermodesulfobacteriota bacterium]|nr:hypothetical protein [Thermodesulfobacteriota bacterium]
MKKILISIGDEISPCRLLSPAFAEAASRRQASGERGRVRGG